MIEKWVEKNNIYHLYIMESIKTTTVLLQMPTGISSNAGCTLLNLCHSG